MKKQKLNYILEQVRKKGRNGDTILAHINPLEVFLYKEGFARLSTEAFSLDPNDIDKLYIHLTNVAV